MYRLFYRLAWLPFQIERIFRLNRRFVNTTAGYIGIKIVKKGYWYHIAAGATKSKE